MAQHRSYRSYKGDLMKSILFTVTALTWTLNASADAVYYTEQYNKIQKHEVYEIVTDEEGNENEVLVQSKQMPSDLAMMLKAGAKKAMKNKNPQPGPGMGEVIMVTKDLVALGKEIYQFIADNQPVVTVDSTPVSVLPRDLKGAPIEALALSNWRAPKVSKFKVVAKNYLGMTPVSFEFMLIYSYGGQYDGRGAFITGAQVKPTNISVTWGYTLDATFSVNSITNMGSTENPLATATLMLDYQIKTIMKETRSNRTFFISGQGQAHSLQ